MNGLEMKYFVLNPNKDDAYGQASREAVFAYAESIKDENPKLSRQLKLWRIRIISKRFMLESLR
jgi:hypothetical protein